MNELKELIEKQKYDFEYKFFPLENDAITMLSWTPKGSGGVGIFFQSSQRELIEKIISIVEEMPIVGYLDDEHVGNQPVEIIAKGQILSLLQDAIK